MWDEAYWLYPDVKEDLALQTQGSMHLGIVTFRLGNSLFLGFA